MADPVVTSHHGIAPAAEPGQTVTFTLDGRQVQAEAGEFLIAAAERAGTFIPRFCYHPRMKPVGMCRMCLVEVSGPRGPSLQPACFVPVAEGMEVVTTSDRVKKAQDGVLEFLLVNHPLDCPVCDKGGECPLQDQALSYGPGESRFVEEKRHWAKPTPISALVLLDRERCIQCGRCVRFAAEVAGEAEIDFLGRGDRVEVAIFERQPFDSVFSGNTVQICPVGALTATPYRFVARPWDVEQVESTCTTCALGCRVAVQSSADRLTRLLGVDSEPLNQSWLCDKGRFASLAVNAEQRLREPLVRRSEELVPVGWAEALDEAARRLRELRDRRGPEAIGVLGGARLANEDAYVWARLAKAVLGTDSVDCQLADGLPPELVLGLPRATVAEACDAPVVLVLAGDLRQELPVLHLRLRQAVDEGRTRLVQVAPYATPLGRLGTNLVHRPGEAPAVVAALLGEGPVPEGVDPDALARVREQLAGAGEAGEGVVVVLGRPSLAEGPEATAAAALALARRWPGARFLSALRRGNVHGALDMGLAPGLLPGRVTLEAGRGWFEAAWGSVPARPGRDAAGMLRALAEGEMAGLVLLGADPLGDLPDRQLAEAALGRAELLIALDGVLTPSAARAQVVLPVAVHHERAGTVTNLEGRVSRVAPKVTPPGQSWPDWMVAVALAERLGSPLPYQNLSEIWEEVERLAPAYRGLDGAVLARPELADGVVVPLREVPLGLPTRRPARLDPMATPGILQVDQQGAPLVAGRAVPLGGGELPSLDGRAAPAALGAREAGALGEGTLSEPSSGDGEPPATHPAGAEQGTAQPGVPLPAIEAPALPPPSPGRFRLATSRALYDEGVAVDLVPELAALVRPAAARLHPEDLAALGATRVRVRSGNGSVVLGTEADPGVARGTVLVAANVPADGQGGRVADLVDLRSPVTEVTLEAVAGEDSSREDRS
jgi:NADH-quinone oxidoreductase subunit G